MWPFNNKKKKESKAAEATRIAIALRHTYFHPTSITEALKISISSLEADVFPYRWQGATTCNCGIVVQALLGLSKEGINILYNHAKIESRIKLEASWKQIAQNSCTITGMPLTYVFRKLHTAGFEIKDIVHLEYMTNKAILDISGINTKEKEYYASRENLILYLRAWLKILTGNEEEMKLSDSALLEAKLLIATAGKDEGESKRLRNELTLIN